VPKLPRVKASAVIRALERLGFVQIRQKGSHIVMKKRVFLETDPPEETEIGCAVPLHQKTLAVGTLKSILKQAGVTVEEFIENL